MNRLLISVMVIVVTMRTRGNDDLLALGMLYSEGIIQSIEDVESINSEFDSIHFSLRESSSFNPEIHCRSSTVTSACGICGRSTIDDVLHMHVPVSVPDPTSRASE